MIDQKRLQQKSRLGTILINRRYVTQVQLDKALELQASSNLRLGEALIELGFIDQKQLKRALRRQNWLRSITAGVALVLAPFSPAFAASQGTTGKSSSASSQISVTILPKTILNGEQSLKLGQGRSNLTDPLCFSNYAAANAGTFIYSVKAAGSGDNGEFSLKDENSNTINYQVAFQHEGKGFDSLNAKQSSSSYQVDSNSKLSCSRSALSQLKVSLSKENKDLQKGQIAKSPYAGALTLIVAAE